MGDFAKSVKASCNKVLAEVDQACYKVFYEAATTAVVRSPVDKGLLINQWYPKTGDQPSTELGVAVNVAGVDSLSRISALYNTKEFYRKDGTMTLTNNVSYSYIANTLGWLPPEWSGKTGPYEMIQHGVIAALGKYG